jgi:hypothetical protein
MKKRNWWPSLSLTFIILTFFFPTHLLAQGVLRPAAPHWSVGDWWVVDCQVYDFGDLVAGPSQPGWLPKQSWRFQVEEMDTIGDEQFFVVSIRPVESSSCPYWFRVWYRNSDRYVARYELYHPTGSKQRPIGPPVVRKDFSPQGAHPFFTGKFPSVPLTVPLFASTPEALSSDTIGQRSVSFSDKPKPTSFTSSEFETVQDVEEADKSELQGKADPDLLAAEGKTLAGNNIKIRIRTETSGLEERQYWNADLPWCVYGERTQKSVLCKRYWLVDWRAE